MDFENSSKISEITLRILKEKDIECSPFNILRYLVPIAVDTRKPIILRNSSLCLICEVICSLEDQGLSECSSLLYDLFTNIKVNRDCFASYPHFIKALSYILSKNTIEPEENSIFSEYIIHILDFSSRSSDNQIINNFGGIFSNPIYSSFIFRYFCLVLLQSKRRKASEASNLLSLFEKLPFCTDSFIDYGLFASALGHAFSLGNNVLYNEIHSFLHFVSPMISSKHSIYSVLVGSKPPLELTDNFISWVKNISVYMDTSVDYSKLLDELYSYFLSIPEAFVKDQIHICEGLIENCLKPNVSEYFYLKLHGSKSKKDLFISLLLIKPYFSKKSVLTPDDFRFLCLIAEIRDLPDLPEMFSLIDSIFTKALSLNLSAVLEEVPLFVEKSCIFRSWILDDVQNVGVEDLDFFSHYFLRYIQFDHLDNTISTALLSLWNIFPKFLLNTTESQKIKNVMPLVLESIKLLPRTRPILLVAFKEYFSKCDPDTQLVKDLVILSLQIFVEEQDDYASPCISAFLRVCEDTPALFSDLLNRIKNEGKVSNFCKLVRLLQPFIALSQEFAQKILDFFLENRGSDKTGLFATSFSKILVSLFCSYPKLFSTEFFNFLSIKEKLKILKVLPFTPELFNLFLPEIILSLKDASKRVRHLSNRLLSFWSSRSSSSDLLEIFNLIIAGIISSSPTMISASINALQIVLESNSTKLHPDNFSQIIKCLVSLEVRKNEVVKSISLFFLSAFKFHDESFSIDSIELILNFFFGIPGELLNHSLNNIKEFITLLGPKYGWEKILEMFPQKGSLISHLRKESRQLSAKSKKIQKHFVREERIKIKIK